MRYTQGPWKPYAVDRYEYRVHGAVGSLAESTIATVKFGLDAETSTEQAQAAEANARLIAAAPELLEALTAIVEANPEWDEDLPDWYNAAKNAIAKAEGVCQS